MDEIKTFPIHLAIKYGLEHVVCQLLELGADIKMTDTEERMLQIVSAKSTLYKSVNCLLQQKLEFAAVTSDGFCPLGTERIAGTALEVLELYWESVHV